MSEFLLEIYGEEIPSSCHKMMKEQFNLVFESFFSQEKISFSELEIMSTSRRISVLSKKLSRDNRKEDVEIKGPKINADSKAINGFLRSQNLNSINQLKKKFVGDYEYYFFKKNQSPKNIEEVLEKNLYKVISSIKWNKSMRWSDHSDKWIRPIKNIFCLFNKKKIDFCFGGINSSNFSIGNYHYTDKKIRCLNISSYKNKLKDKKVILDGEERKKIIKRQLLNFCRKKNLNCELDENLLEKVSNSVEWPNVFFGVFDKSFYELPDFLLKTIISEKQDNFCFYNNKKLSNYFAFVSNKSFKSEKNLISGNQNVLKARFSDAKFFLEEDKKNSFESRHKKLSSIIFYDNLGTLFERSERLVDLCQVLADNFDFNLDHFKKYLRYSNVDLTTEIVKEFPSLQGRVGGYYANIEGFKSEINEAFSLQYENSLVFNKLNLTIILAIAQKADSVFGFFLSKKKISGSGDPFGVRRNVLSIIKILIENNLSIDIEHLFDKTKSIYKKQKIDIEFDTKLIYDFFKKRIEVYLLSKGFSHSLIRANLKLNRLNPSLIYKKTTILNEFLESDDGKVFFSACKRLDSIVDQTIKKEKVDDSLFQLKEEKILYLSMNELKKIIKNEQNKTNFKIFRGISKPINDFLDNVMVNVQDKKIQNNRKNLLLECQTNINHFFNFSSL